jgi:colanic acid/amylovoran biosynthesis protein
MVKIIITGSNSTLDNGEAALLVASMAALTKVIPNVEFVVGSAHQEIDQKRYALMLPEANLKVIASSKAKKFSIRAFLLLFRYVPEYAHSDIGVDLSGDGFGDYGPYGAVSSFTHVYQLLLGLILHKPVIVYAQSIGPFKLRLTRSLARFTLNKVSAITVREEITGTYLKEIGVNNPNLFLTADAAFLLEPSLPSVVDRILEAEGLTTSPYLVGISISQLIHQWAFHFSSTNHQRYDQYIELMAKVADYVVEKTGATVFLYCQTVGSQARHDDSVAAKLVFERIQHKSKAKLLHTNYTTAELKGVIGRCQMFIGSKLHSTIASTSMLVPTVSIAYSHKVHGIIGTLLNQQQVIIDIRKLEYDAFCRELLQKIDFVWINRYTIKEELAKKMRVVKPLSLQNAQLVAKIIEGKRSRLTLGPVKK